jgi:hypothetical protein
VGAIRVCIKPTPVTHSSTRRAYWRVLRCPARSTRLGQT